MVSLTEPNDSECTEALKFALPSIQLCIWGPGAASGATVSPKKRTTTTPKNTGSRRRRDDWVTGRGRWPRGGFRGGPRPLRRPPLAEYFGFCRGGLAGFSRSVPVRFLYCSVLRSRGTLRNLISEFYVYGCFFFLNFDLCVVLNLEFGSYLFFFIIVTKLDTFQCFEIDLLHMSRVDNTRSLILVYFFEKVWIFTEGQLLSMQHWRLRIDLVDETRIAMQPNCIISRLIQSQKLTINYRNFVPITGWIEMKKITSRIYRTCVARISFCISLLVLIS